MAKHVLLVDDDSLMRRSLAFNLEQSGYRVSSAGRAEDAFPLARRDAPDVVLLDIGLPEMDGLEALRQLRQFLTAPVIFLTARRKDFDVVLGLELGADDYVTKPFDMHVLLARVKAALRRRESPVTLMTPPPPLVVGDLTIDPVAHLVTVEGRPVHLSPREFELLYALALQPGQVLRIHELVASVWGAEYEGEPQVIYVHIRWLREKLEQDPQHPRRILSVRGVGYKLEA